MNPLIDSHSDWSGKWLVREVRWFRKTRVGLCIDAKATPVRGAPHVASPRRCSTWVAHMRMLAVRALVVLLAMMQCDAAHAAVFAGSGDVELSADALKQMQERGMDVRVIDGVLGRYYAFDDILVPVDRVRKRRDGSLKVALGGRMWENSTFFYMFHESIPEADRQAIRSMLWEWGDQSGVRMKEGADVNKLALFVNDVGAPASVCGRSLVGWNPGGQEIFLNMQSIWAGRCGLRRTVLHEVGHAIGLYHEHQRADRGLYVRVDYTGAPDPNFYPREAHLLSAYDFASVMHYHSRTAAATLTALTAQPPGEPGGSEYFCLFPEECTDFMGTSSVSPRDALGVSKFYGYRLHYNLVGAPPSVLAFKGNSTHCYDNCIIYHYQVPVGVVALPLAYHEPRITWSAGLNCWDKHCDGFSTRNMYMDVEYSPRPLFADGFEDYTPMVLRTGVGKCLQVVPGQERVNGALVQAWDCNGGANQRWRVRDSVAVSAHGKCLDVHAPDQYVNGARVQIWDCNGSSQQSWGIYPGSAGSSRIVTGVGRCLDIHAPDQYLNGARVQVWQCNDEIQQRWSYEAQ